MIINLVLFFIPKRQEIYRLYLIKKRKKLAYMRLNSKSLTYLKSNRSSTAPVTFNIDSYKTYIIFVNHDGGNNSVVSLIYAESNPKLIELYRVGAVFTINLKNKTLAITSSTTYWNYTIIYV